MKNNFNKNNGRRGSATHPNDEGNNNQQAIQNVNTAPQTNEAGPSTSRRDRRPTLDLTQARQLSNLSTPTEGPNSSSPRGSKRKSPQDEEHESESPKKAKKGHEVSTTSTVKGKGTWNGKGKVKETMSPTRTQPSRGAKRPATPKSGLSPPRTQPKRSAKRPASPKGSAAHTKGGAWHKGGNQPESSATAAKRAKPRHTKQQQDGRQQGQTQQDGTQQDGTQQDGTQQDGTQQDGTQQDGNNQPNAPAPYMNFTGPPAPTVPAPAPVFPAPKPPPPGTNAQCAHNERCAVHPPFQYFCAVCEDGVCETHKRFCGGKPAGSRRNRNWRG
ncbi:hypothetical protein M409DRAFT_51118 [Zasmidium cellare ATCC 36951]|uniref:Uncharacterized protein n=1 Tax=Zasmidium cellare ATCC 36951 TaxID=1080233 RepID=A0A6A6CUU2_ZASCE|nr:uncharacterized protein M409DRAFT_51118 [Zasmidium cellare ATCC 36951]KAF2170871.1 hypothetical protein M409DRAFT_51118 [Zasmidium cellare ATCC 36951]